MLCDNPLVLCTQLDIVLGLETWTNTASVIEKMLSDKQPHFRLIFSVNER